MDIPIYQIDAFTTQPFAGNPAAVCPLQYWLDDALMQKIAAENNLAETAFFVRNASGDYRIRWFTPKCEVDLCGHATLAAAWVLWEKLNETAPRLVFDSASGPLAVSRDAAHLVLDFPLRPLANVALDEGLTNALGKTPMQALCSDGTRALCVFTHEAHVAALAPDFAALSYLPYRVVYVTAPSRTYDFVARVFAPQMGIDEDPVTGSAYTSLTPYWAARLRRERLSAKQISARGGELTTTLCGSRVQIAGQAVCVMTGTLTV